MKKKFLYFLMAILVFVLTGCATVMTGTSQKIAFSSNVPEAKVFVNNVQVGVTPAVLELATGDGKDVSIRIEAPGYKPYVTVLRKKVTGWVWGNILIGGIIGLGVDLITGGVYVFEKEAVDGNLERISVGNLEKN